MRKEGEGRRKDRRRKEEARKEETTVTVFVPDRVCDSLN